jgi:hypothetical protein
MSARALRLAAAAGLVGGVLAALVGVVPALVAPGTDGRFASYAAVLVALIAVQLGTRAAAAAPEDAGFRPRLAAAALIAALVAVLDGFGLYLLYAALKPGLLATRYAGYEAHLWSAGLAPQRLAAGLAALTARRAQYLDPAYQALEGAGTPLFCGLVLGAYLAFRARVAARLGRRPGA